MGFRWFIPNGLIYYLGDMVDLTKTPDNLPIPEDDGAANHLVGMTLPKLSLQATNNQKIDFSSHSKFLVIYLHVVQIARGFFSVS